MRNPLRTSVATASAAVGAGAGTVALTDTLGHAGSGTALAVGGIAAVAVAVASLATGTWVGRDGTLLDGKMKEFLNEDWPEIRWADLPSGTVRLEPSAPANLGAYVYSRWCKSSRSLQQAGQVLTGLPLPDLSPIFGRARLDTRGRVTSSHRFPSATEFFVNGRRPGEVEWVEFQAAITGSQPSQDGPWTRLIAADADAGGQSIQLRSILVAISLPSDREHSLVGVVSPLSSLTEAMFALIQERFEAELATPRFQVRDLIRPGIQVRSARFATPDAELVERYEDQTGFFQRASRLNEREIEGVTLEMADVSVNVFRDGQVYLHNVTPENVPIVISRIAPVIWPPSD